MYMRGIQYRSMFAALFRGNRPKINDAVVEL